jgi:hypothetical protein
MADREMARLQVQAAKVREIAQGLYDHRERRVVLAYVADTVKRLNLPAKPSRKPAPVA